MPPVLCQWQTTHKGLPAEPAWRISGIFWSEKPWPFSDEMRISSQRLIVRMQVCHQLIDAGETPALSSLQLSNTDGHARSEAIMSGKELVAAALREELEKQHIQLANIDPGKPWQNGISQL